MLRDSSGGIEVFGHEVTVQAILRCGLANTLIVGPSSVGKRTILEKLIEESSVLDVVRLMDLTQVDMADVRKMTLESFSETRVILIRLNYKMKRKAYEQLLKIIEDAPPSVTFLATSTYQVPFTLSSRFTKYTVSSLSDADVATILSRMQYAPDKAVELATIGLGAINPTIYAGKSSEFLSLANRALKCIEEKDEDTMDSLYSKWEEGHTRAITDWASERITGKWRRFQSDDFPMLGKDVALKILQEVDYYDRPRYVVRNSLVSIVREMCQ